MPLYDEAEYERMLDKAAAFDLLVKIISGTPEMVKTIQAHEALFRDHQELLTDHKRLEQKIARMRHDAGESRANERAPDHRGHKLKIEVKRLHGSDVSWAVCAFDAILVSPGGVHVAVASTSFSGKVSEGPYVRTLDFEVLP
jgi:hypothetical protein